MKKYLILIATILQSSILFAQNASQKKEQCLKALAKEYENYHEKIKNRYFENSTNPSAVYLACDDHYPNYFCKAHHKQCESYCDCGKKYKEELRQKGKEYSNKQNLCEEQYNKDLEKEKKDKELQDEKFLKTLSQKETDLEYASNEVKEIVEKWNENMIIINNLVDKLTNHSNSEIRIEASKIYAHNEKLKDNFSKKYAKVFGEFTKKESISLTELKDLELEQNGIISDLRTLEEKSKYIVNDQYSNQNEIGQSAVKTIKAFSKIKRTKEFDPYDVNSYNMGLSVDYIIPLSKDDALYTQGIGFRFFTPSWGEHFLFSYEFGYYHYDKKPNSFYASLYNVPTQSLESEVRYSTISMAIHIGPYFKLSNKMYVAFLGFGGINGVLFQGAHKLPNYGRAYLKEIEDKSPPINFSYGGNMKFFIGDFYINFVGEFNSTKAYTPIVKYDFGGSTTEMPKHLVNLSFYSIGIGYRLF